MEFNIHQLGIQLVKLINHKFYCDNQLIKARGFADLYLDGQGCISSPFDYPLLHS